MSSFNVVLLLILGVIAVALVVAAIVLIILLVRRSKESSRRHQQSAAQPPRDPFAPDSSTAGDPRTLKAGDLLQFGDDKAWIRGSLRYREGMYVWAEHFFQADTHSVRQWLSVEEDPLLQMAVWRDRPDVQLEPGPRRLVVDGITFTFSERGTASFRGEGTTGLPPHGTSEYADYESSDGTLLGFERFGNGRWEVSMGRPLPVGSFTIYPGGGI
ncbi:DUF4178 domain-containing protein [Brevibacterium yomogidense]|uniref:DUF4178 domain-containing protein n=1 Tax=Brevibacterium yomogidense TaxID=946573 RepID=A0A1X6XE66_9MICO|nr:DUF4178 domain-containing protein [Brevibacterium yomogidense]SLM97554.1 hypothetical protein FM105_07295 [Brevibacterium yomogidense]